MAFGDLKLPDTDLNFALRSCDFPPALLSFGAVSGITAALNLQLLQLLLCLCELHSGLLRLSLQLRDLTTVLPVHGLSVFTYAEREDFFFFFAIY